jgi:carbon storage regulator
MLHLSRKVGERIYIDGEIVIEVVDIGEGRVRIGIDAPKEVAIRRDDYRPKEVKP